MRSVISLDVVRTLRSSRQRQRPLALTLHWPAGTANDACRRSLAEEAQWIGRHLDQRQPVAHFQWRGAAAVAEVQAMMGTLHARFNFFERDRGDYAIDLAPRHTDWASVGLLRELGFNHVCISAPDACAEVESSTLCYRNPAPIQSLIDAARTFDFRSVSVDLGYGAAWQTLASFESKLDSLITLAPDRLHLFDYARPPRRYRAQPTQAHSGAMRQLSFERLAAAGYHYIGQGQFARSDDDFTQAQERGNLRRTGEGFTVHGDCDHISLGDTLLW